MLLKSKLFLSILCISLNSITACKTPLFDGPSQAKRRAEPNPEQNKTPNLPDESAAFEMAKKSSGCFKVNTLSTTQDRNISINNQTRKYLLVAPATYEKRKAYALIFWWHGAASSPEQTRGIPNYNHSPNIEKISSTQAISIHPRHIPGTGLTWDRSANGRDFQLFDGIYEEITSNYCIDLDKVFTIGVSNGGTFANHLSSIRPEKIKGVVAVAVPAMGSGWRKVNTRSMLIQDDRDNFASAQLTLKKMAADAECDLTNAQLTPQNPASCIGLGQCTKGKAVAFCAWKVKAGWNPHDWPRFDGADEQIWRFLLGADEPN